ncbi:MAG: LytTR family DNA-binding domain-containing protein [Candidatus Pseudobacter hemicellulosilyticus]|uniref:LytTR family DNA-binding domain-containing protein n=1 Tax=Candidatus Pseudobacter hemicellulosilyticus TaxID=3121375 RepID=A0AAJ5WQK5_9BACT|nr:MAG: LytTR family DNA-binding domain-containing protein [Pseudobacter sp.]
MIRCLIVEDEPIAQQIVEQFILQTAGLTLVGKCRNALEAFAKLEQVRVDLLFLDIEMPLVNGMTFLKTLSQPPQVILTTAYSDYAVQAFELDVVDYLLKPFSYDRFLKAVAKVKTPAASAVEPEQQTGHLLVREKGGLLRIPYPQIRYIQASKDYVKLFIDSQQFLANYTMKQLEELLPAGQFIRIHKSYIVALAQIRMVKAEEVLLGTEEALPLSAHYKEQLMEWFKGR